MSESSGGGISFAGLLTVLFIGLKLTGHIDWSWWWVTAPVTVPLALWIVLTVLIWGLER